tara:strand:+ start:6076 stop:6402 length:327 start_codon:yes stop_codon:yes gene_type:complete
MLVNHFEADMYFVDEQGRYCYEAEKIPQAHQWCQEMTKKSLQNKESVVVSNTFIRRWEIVPYMKMAKRFGARFEVIECHEQYGNIHGVKPETVLQMKKRWQTWQNVPQ